MKAIVHKKYGSPEVLHLVDVEKPIPKNNEVLIKIVATTVNRTDCAFRKAEPAFMRLITGFIKPRKTILGNEFAGDIEAIGQDVKSFKIGDAVFGLNCWNHGTHAEYVCVSETGSIALKPNNMDYEQAASACDGAWYALIPLKKMNIQKGQKILINGATGSIGSAAVQLAKYFGAEVTAVGNTKNLDLIKSLGADEVIDYLKEDFTKSEKLYDFIFDAVGKSSFFKCKKLLVKNGIYISTELGFLGQNVFLALWPFKMGKKVFFPIPVDSQKIILFFKELIESKKLVAVIDRRYPLEQVAEAYRYVEKGEKTGNVVIHVSN